MTKETDNQKLKDLARAEGHETILPLLEASAHDSVYLAICTLPGCDYIREMEPDQDRGWCEECEANTVKSALMLAGVI